MEMMIESKPIITTRTSHPIQKNVSPYGSWKIFPLQLAEVLNKFTSDRNLFVHTWYEQICVISRFSLQNKARPFRFGWLPWCLSRFSRSWPLSLPCVHDCQILLRKSPDWIVCAAPKFLSQKVTVAFQNQPTTWYSVYVCETFHYQTYLVLYESSVFGKINRAFLINKVHLVVNLTKC